MNQAIEFSLGQLLKTDRELSTSYFHRGKALRRFLKEQPRASGELEEYYDALHPGWYNWIDRIVTSKKAKLAFFLNQTEHSGRIKRFVQRHTVTWKLLVGLQLFVSALCPAHPVAIDGYLAAAGTQMASNWVSMYCRRAAVRPDSALKAFILSPEEIQRYREGLLEDAEDTSSEKGFVIARDRAGKLEHIRVHSLHEHLGSYVPGSIRRLLDRRFVFGFNERVGLWLDGKELVASGHYHVYGGPPSLDDLKAMKATSEARILVSNGVIPFVYFEGVLLDYGQAEDYAPDLDGWLKNLTAVIQYSEDYSVQPDRALGQRRIRSFLYFAKDYDGVDIRSSSTVKKYLSATSASLQKTFAPLIKREGRGDEYSNFFMLDLISLDNYTTYREVVEKCRRS